MYDFHPLDGNATSNGPRCTLLSLFSGSLTFYVRNISDKFKEIQASEVCVSVGYIEHHWRVVCASLSVGRAGAARRAAPPTACWACWTAAAPRRAPGCSPSGSNSRWSTSGRSVSAPGSGLKTRVGRGWQQLFYYEFNRFKVPGRNP